MNTSISVSTKFSLDTQNEKEGNIPYNVHVEPQGETLFNKHEYKEESILSSIDIPPHAISNEEVIANISSEEHLLSQETMEPVFVEEKSTTLFENKR